MVCWNFCDLLIWLRMSFANSVVCFALLRQTVRVCLLLHGRTVLYTVFFFQFVLVAMVVFLCVCVAFVRLKKNVVLM